MLFLVLRLQKLSRNPSWKQCAECLVFCLQCHNLVSYTPFVCRLESPCFVNQILLHQMESHKSHVPNHQPGYRWVFPWVFLWNHHFPMGFPMTSTIFPWVFLWNPSFSHGFSYEITIFPWVFPWNPPFSPDYCSPGPRASLPDVAPVTLAHTGRRVGRVGRVGPKDGRWGNGLQWWLGYHRLLYMI